MGRPWERPIYPGGYPTRMSQDEEKQSLSGALPSTVLARNEARVRAVLQAARALEHKPEVDDV